MMEDTQDFLSGSLSATCKNGTWDKQWLQGHIPCSGFAMKKTSTMLGNPCLWYSGLYNTGTVYCATVLFCTVLVHHNNTKNIWVWWCAWRCARKQPTGHASSSRRGAPTNLPLQGFCRLRGLKTSFSRHLFLLPITTSRDRPPSIWGWYPCKAAWWPSLPPPWHWTWRISWHWFPVLWDDAELGADHSGAKPACCHCCWYCY